MEGLPLSPGGVRWRGLAAVALWIALGRTATGQAVRTVYVDGGCATAGDGSSLACGAGGPLRHVGDAIRLVAPLAGKQAVRIVVRGAHDGFDGVYPEYIKLWGDQALGCTQDQPCVIEGCSSSLCPTAEIPVVSGFITPTDGWTAVGSGDAAVYTRTVEPRGESTEPAGAGQAPYDAYFGVGSGLYNPVYLLEGPTRTALGYGGSCAADFATPCATAAHCAPGQACDLSAPPDGFWSFSCLGDPVTACLIHVNPHGAGDPRTGQRIWIPDRNALLAADGRVGCPQNEAGCPATSFLTLRRFVFEGTRWIGLNLQNDELGESQQLTLEQLTIRYAPRFALRTQRVSDFSVDGLVLEEAGRGLSFDTGGTFGLRLFGIRRGKFSHVVARHYGNAGRRDTKGDGVGGELRPCPHCDAPWNDPAASVWGPPCDVFDVKQSRNVNISDFEITDVAGGARVDCAVGVTLERGLVRRTRTGIIVNQLTPSATEGFTRTYDVTLRNLRMDENGDDLRGAINLGSNIGGDQVCLTPPQSGEFLRVYNNVITHSGLAGALVCLNTKFCAGGAYALATCRTDEDCPNSTCVDADGTGKVEIYNNTIFGDRAGYSATGVMVRNGLEPDGQPAVAGLYVVNNIIAGVTGDGVEVPRAAVERGGVVLDANLYFDPSGDRSHIVRWGDARFQTLTELRAAAGAELKGVEADPAFTNPAAMPPDLHIRLESGARDAGTRIAGIEPLLRDIDAQTRGEKWDIGADEFRCHQDADCSDGNACNGDERCFGGFCGGASTPLDCDDGSDCTTDVCKTLTGCQHKPLADGSSCDDGDVCTPSSSCEAGRCVGRNATVCPPPDSCHLQGGCGPDTGACLPSPPAPDGTACNDNDVCTSGDACRDGACSGLRCAGDPCTQCTARGCVPFAPGSFDAVACAFRRPLSVTECVGQRVPNGVIENYGAALALLDHAGPAAACDSGKRNAFGRAGFRVIRALKKLDGTQKRRARQKLSSECYSPLRRLLSDARHRAQAASAACTPP